jgi:maleate isomerase
VSGIPPTQIKHPPYPPYALGDPQSMRDVRGERAVLGVVGPSTNTVVQPDFDDLRVPGVTNHYSRIVIQDAQAVSDETFLAGTMEISSNTLDAVSSVMTCRPDYLVMGMSAVTFYNGKAGAAEFRERIEDASGIGVSIGSESLSAALDAMGGIKRIAILSPYFPIANVEVIKYLGECGYEVVRDACLRCPSWTAIAKVPEDYLTRILRELDGSDVDAICQVGTNLSMMRLAGEIEQELGKPVIAINTATYWHALRGNGINDVIPGFGRLLEEH